MTEPADASAAAPAPAGITRGATLAFWSAFFAISLNLVIMAPLLPGIAIALERSIAELGLLITAFALPYALLALILGPASERLGRRTLIVAGMVIFTIGQVLAALAPQLPALMLARGLIGLGAAAFTPAAYAYIGDHTLPAQRATTISTILLAATIGSIVGLPLGGLAVSLAGWRGAFWLLAGLGLLDLLLLLLVIKRDQPQPTGRRYLSDLTAVTGAPGTWLVMVITIGWSAGYNGTLNYTGALLAERYGLSTEQIATALTGLGIGGVVGNRLGAWLNPRLGDRRTLVTAIILLMTAILLLPITTVAVPLSVAIASLLPAGVQLGWPALLSVVSDLAPRYRATALALNSSVYYLGAALGPPLTGLIVGALGIGAMGLAGIVTTGLALALALSGSRQQKRQLNSPPPPGPPT